MGHDETRGKSASDSPKPAEDGTNPVSELADLHSAFDSIDDNMKDVARREVMVTPETLEQIVNDAVAKALTAYEQARGATPDSPTARPGAAAAPNQAGDVVPRQPADASAVPRSEWRAKLERLQGDMGLDEIEFDSAASEPAETVGHRTLSAQMGVHDFEFDDAPEAGAEPAVAVPLDIEGVTEWMAATAATPTVDRLRSTATGTSKIGAADQQFDWVAAELAELDAVEARSGGAEPPPAPRTTPPMPADSVPPQPEPEIEAPPPVAAPPEETPRPTREPAAALKPTTAEEAADTVRFTFDPIPPVPPRLPREPNEPPKKINKSGTFL